MLCTQCDSRLISDQLLRVLMVNKHMNSDSQQIWDMLRDGWAAVPQQAVVGLVHECMHESNACIGTQTHTCTRARTHNRARAHEHSWRHGVLTWVALTRTCHHLHSTSTISMNVNFSVSHRQRGTMICVCMCVLPNLLPHSYYTEDALPRHPCISIPSWPTPSWETEICECMLRRSTL